MSQGLKACPKGWKRTSMRCCPQGRVLQSCSSLQESQVGPQHLSKFLRYQGRFDPKVPSDYFLALLCSNLLCCHNSKHKCM